MSSKRQQEEEKKIDQMRAAQNKDMKFDYIGVNQKALVSGSIAATTTPDFVETSTKGKKNRKKR